MKKALFVTVLAAAAAAGSLFSNDFAVSAGLGGFFTSDFGGGLEVGSGNTKITTETPYYGGGVFLFVDAIYAELNASIFSAWGTYTVSAHNASTESATLLTNVNLGLLLKYPFRLTPSFSLFPLLGVEYPLVLGYKIDGKKIANPDDFSAVWFKAGIGVDIAVSAKGYVRLEALYGLRLPNRYENNAVDAYKQLGLESPKTRLGHGLTVKAAFGYD